MRNILVTGSNGQLGNAIKKISSKLINYNFLFTDIEELDITSYEQIGKFIHKNKINIVINCAAYTAVDQAETDREKAFLINVTAVEYLSIQAKANNATLIHISTDYVFDGSSQIPYKETDLPDPKSYYGLTKYEAEQKIAQFAENAIIIRTSWLHSEYGHNFVKTMIRLGYERESLNIINDQFGSPTYAADLADTIIKLTQATIKGIIFYNYSNEGSCTWYEFAKAIMELKKINCVVNPITTEEYPTAAVRPKYSLLDKSKIKKELDIEIPFWKESLKTCLKNI
ncbi:MAG: dTDP-4-dehydrorhamnose reductase [Bacteroidetes bacterium HGW-Bacteroidetes-17]|nr:MAG: dTDP-4-dehydrorhamnose reductase [Bacteroidetes bacterium HGW-Bacteroidetes-17]